MTWFYFILLLLVVGLLLYNRASMIVSLIATAAALACLTGLAVIPITSMILLWLVWLVFLPFGIYPIRRRLMTARILKAYQKSKPTLSETEQEALEAGTVWWDQELFSGNPHWQRLFAVSKAELSEEEQAFLEGPVATLCDRINEWEIIHKHGELPAEIWQYLREQGFFALIIPKSYGGKGFSALAHLRILTKIFSCSVTVGSTVAVPNSLGPAELLLEYGTDSQKQYYLPRLAAGDEIPCFALTSPDAGSDAAAMTDQGVVCRAHYQGEETLGIRLNWNKRYITLAPVATVLGLAFKLYDPDHLLGDQAELGITCALIPTHTEGVEIGRRHLPTGTVFQNGPTQGKDVFIPLDWIIGGVKMAGQGWRMLMECLAAGRSISLPASGVAGCKVAAFASGAYSRIRRQFNMPIGCFEGVEEVLARIVAHAYQTHAATTLTAQAIDQGEKPSVLSGIVKYHCTEAGRQAVIDAMDIHGGKGICLGPNNYLAYGYQSLPVGITVEGANILTRNMIIFGQGAIRCHPFVLAELKAATANDLAQFDKSFFGHVGFLLSNIVRALTLGLSNGYLAFVPKGRLRRYLQHTTRFSTALALMADVTMLALGSELKRKERLSARLGDILSHLYMLSAVAKHYVSDGSPAEEYPVVQWLCQELLFKTEKALFDLLDNYPKRGVAWLLRLLIFPMGRRFKKPSDRLDHKLASLIINDTQLRQQVGQGIHWGKRGTNQAGLLQEVLQQAIAIEPIEKTVRFSAKSGDITGTSLTELVNAAAAKGVISEEEKTQWQRVDKLRQQIIQVDDFEPDEIT